MTRDSGTRHAGSSSSFVTLLAILFIALKLTREISWSWWWVLAPLWGGLAIAAVIIAGLLIAAGIVTLMARWRS